MRIAVHPGDAPTALLRELRECGFEPVRVHDTVDVADGGPWAAIVVTVAADGVAASRFARLVGGPDNPPVIMIFTAEALDDGTTSDGSDDFLVYPYSVAELDLRLRRLVRRAHPVPETLSFKDLVLNLATYQATVDSRPIDLTYMEYELLRFFAANAGRVWSREQLLNQVWGYDYFGGSRTVDVHVRRLRAKLGEERASWITTVRSVGYRFG